MGLARSGSSVVSRSRQRPLRAQVWCAVWSWLWLAGGVARADEGLPRHAQLVVDADAGCIDADGLRARVDAKDWRWADERVDLLLAASVRAQAAAGSGMQVALQLRWPDGRSAQRALAAQSCEAALDALALLIQMTLDAESRSRESPDSGEIAPTDLANDAGESTRWSALTRLALGASVGLSAAAAPAPQPGLGLYAALELRGFGLVRPRLQLEFLHAWRSGIAVAGGTADFALTGGQLLLCPVAVRSGAFAAHGCGTFELARLRAQGRDVYEPRAQAHGWASAGFGLLMHARLMSALELQLAAALSRPLWRDQFSFAPDVFYAVPAWRWQIKLGLAVCFL